MKTKKLTKQKKKYRIENGTSENFDDAILSLCKMSDGCGCMTYSILSEDGNNFKCGKCGREK